MHPGHLAKHVVLTQQLAPALSSRQPAEAEAAPEALHQLLEAQRCWADSLRLLGFLGALSLMAMVLGRAPCWRPLSEKAALPPTAMELGHMPRQRCLSEKAALPPLCLHAGEEEGSLELCPGAGVYLRPRPRHARLLRCCSTRQVLLLPCSSHV